MHLFAVFSFFDGGGAAFVSVEGGWVSVEVCVWVSGNGICCWNLRYYMNFL